MIKQFLQWLFLKQLYHLTNRRYQLQTSPGTAFSIPDTYSTFLNPDTSSCSGSSALVFFKSEGSLPRTSHVPDIAMQTPLCTALPAQASLAARPNSHLLYPTVSNECLPISAANVLNAQGIAELLRNYPNQRFVDTLVSIAISGVQVGYSGSLSGHASTFAHPNVIADSIQSDISKGRVKEIASLPANYFCSPIGLTPKTLEAHKQVGERFRSFFSRGPFC